MCKINIILQTLLLALHSMSALFHALATAGQRLTVSLILVRAGSCLWQQMRGWREY